MKANFISLDMRKGSGKQLNEILDKDETDSFKSDIEEDEDEDQDPSPLRRQRNM